MRLTVNPPVFFVSAGALLSFVVFGSAFSSTAAEVFPEVLDTVATNFGWFYILSVAFFVGLCVWLALSKHRHVRLGEDGSQPEFSTPTWFAMLFSAGMGIGLVFYGVAQPMMMYSGPPVGAGGTAEAARNALPLTFFHWGLHAWAIYVVMGLSIAYFAHRRKLPLTLRSAFHPLIGDRIYGWFGHAIDIIAVFGTLFGLATSLGLGAMQIDAGFHHLLGTPTGTSAQIVLIAIITGCATVSLVTGVEKGIRRLSELNMILAALLCVFVFFVGPTLHILEAFPDHLGLYFADFAERTFWTGRNVEGGAGWNKGWTYFYWAWWIAWAPFVGMFLARISKGRTIGEFVVGVLFVPTIVTFVWLSVFGDTALYLEANGAGIAAAVDDNVATAIYVMLDKLPLAAVTSFLAACVVAVFFVTSSDSASFVVDVITSGGRPNPPVWQRVFWAVSEGAVAAVLLGAAGKAGLKALQAAVISIGAPFSIVLVLMCFGLIKALRQDARVSLLARRPDGPLRPAVLRAASVRPAEDDEAPAARR
jgi:choline/glycine/proline betaine transport protein